MPGAAIDARAGSQDRRTLPEITQRPIMYVLRLLCPRDLLKSVAAIPVCHSYASYALRGYYHSRGMQLPNSEDKEDAAVDEERDAGQPQANEELQQVWTEEYTREQLGIAAKRAQQHITEVCPLIENWQRIHLTKKSCRAMSFGTS